MKSSNEQSSDTEVSQFGLLKQKRFAPFFWVQFAGAANDNLFKFAFTVMVTYQLSISWMPPSIAGLVIAALFILPYLLFSATSGQISDKFAKTKLIRYVKDLEIVIMLLGTAGFLLQSPVILLICTFLMGLQSTIFGPLKYAYLPQVLKPNELTGGNGLIEMGTFVAILLGNVAGGLMIAVPEIGHYQVAAACMVLAVLGRLTAQAVPVLPATDPALKINWNPVSETLRNLAMAREQPAVFRSMLGISWMWFFGAVFLSQFPSFSKEVLHGNEQVASLLLVVFSIGIAIGSLLCETLSRRQVEIGLVPIGAIGMSIFSIDLYFATRGLPDSAEMGITAFVQNTAHWRVLIDLLGLSLFAGLYSVPMYALIQMRTEKTHTARIIAANNILNALFMIASSLIAGALLAYGLTIPEVLLVVGVLNALVTFYIFMLVPEYFLRFLSWVLSNLIYRFKVTNKQVIPSEGAVILTCNHVSFIDAVLLMAASPRPIYYIMDHRIFKIPVLGWIFKLAKAIPIAPQKEDPVAYEKAFQQAAQVLRNGDVLAIFPEGAITRNGELGEFKAGLLKILQTAHADGLSVPVIPMGLKNLWGSYFSRVDGAAMSTPFRRGFWSRVGLNIGEPIPGEQVTMGGLKQQVQELINQE